MLEVGLLSRLARHFSWIHLFSRCWSPLKTSSRMKLRIVPPAGVCTECRINLFILCSPGNHLHTRSKGKHFNEKGGSLQKKAVMEIGKRWIFYLLSFAYST